MELIRNAEFVRNLLGIDFKAKVPDLIAVANSWARPQCTDELADGEPYYILFPGASFPGRRWPLASFRQAAEFIYKRPDGVVLSAGESAICPLRTPYAKNPLHRF